MAAAQGGRVLAQSRVRAGTAHARSLLANVRDVLERAGWDMADVDGFGVTVGPGSFTGLRIGIATVKGLAHGLGKPVAGISSLRALAQGCPDPPPLVWACLDARKNQVYAACFFLENGYLQRRTPDAVMDPGQWAARVGETPGPAVCVGDGAAPYRHVVESIPGVAVPDDKEVHAIQPSTVALLAARALSQGDFQAAADIAPVYLRSADARPQRGNRAAP